MKRMHPLQFFSITTPVITSGLLIHHGIGQEQHQFRHRDQHRHRHYHHQPERHHADKDVTQWNPGRDSLVAGEGTRAEMLMREHLDIGLRYGALFDLDSSIDSDAQNEK